MNSENVMTPAEVRELAARANSTTQPCACASAAVAGWERLSPTFPVELLRRVGSLLPDPYAEPSYAEYHPAGTGYWSADAPIALRYFPYNRCELAQCTSCGRAYLRYTEAGGYYTEQRIRALNPDLIVDPPLPEA
ncbi:hypothetical protein GJ700_18880 [Duganella sp. FT92W]|uniref:Uncharacterized protein n=1 Tax=Pseudoduganella rivuli TaxID=2666085 RepID=A0A7X2IPR9_9BURK|nr:hypothetical protein [Pseudoduganella rivuli]MRV73779.1 hypothetical protein [Pseudoduganella rivuli]